MERQTILLVDDDCNVRTLTRLLLESAGYNVLTAIDGEDGLRVYLTHRATLALLLTDLRMPNMNGADLADRVLQLDSKLPILLMTGDGLACPARYEYVAKPVVPAQLVRRIGEALDAPERLREARRVQLPSDDTRSHRDSPTTLVGFLQEVPLDLTGALSNAGFE